MFIKYKSVETTTLSILSKNAYQYRIFPKILKYKTTFNDFIKIINRNNFEINTICKTILKWWVKWKQKTSVIYR